MNKILTRPLVDRLEPLRGSREADSLLPAPWRRQDALETDEDPNISAFHTIWRELARHEDGKEHNATSTAATFSYEGEAQDLSFHPVSRTENGGNPGIVGEVTLPDHSHSTFTLHVVLDHDSGLLEWEELPSPAQVKNVA